MRRLKAVFRYIFFSDNKMSNYLREFFKLNNKKIEEFTHSVIYTDRFDQVRGSVLRFAVLEIIDVANTGT